MRDAIVEVLTLAFANGGPAIPPGSQALWVSPNSCLSFPFPNSPHINSLRSIICLVSSSGLSLLPVGHAMESDDLNSSFNFNSPADDIYSSRRRNAELARGSASVIHQLHFIVSKKWIEIEARVLRVYARAIEGIEERRALILVDVYLPVSIWSGWQFPRWRGVVVSLFKHVSCDWEFRASLLSVDWADNQPLKDDIQIWLDSSCNVFSCEAHRKPSHSSKRKPFELNEIFESLPGIGNDKKTALTRIRPADSFQPQSQCHGIWDISDDQLNNVLALLCPRDLIRIAATCHHL